MSMVWEEYGLDSKKLMGNHDDKKTTKDKKCKKTTNKKQVKLIAPEWR